MLCKPYRPASFCPSALLALALHAMLASGPAGATPADEAAPAIDYLSFAQGALPLAIEGPTGELSIGMEHALLAIDGDPRKFASMLKPGAADTRIAFVYRMPAMTTFSQFAVPDVLETPGASQTFFRDIEIAGSAQLDGPYQTLAQATLTAHVARGMTTGLPATTRTPVRYLRVQLSGGIDVRVEKSYFEFSEIIGHGSQEPVPLLEAFDNTWQGRGVLLTLRQEGERVTGCYDKVGDLSGTVSGNLLHATGRARDTGVPSTFVLTVDDDGAITGVRSTNGAPFRRYQGAPAPTVATECSQRAVAPLGCGAILHGIRFDYDSATIRSESKALLDSLANGLKAESAARITVVGHTSSEGSDRYNDELSRRRAEAVVTALASRGIESSRMAAAGRGEQAPIADNSTDAGRSLNRRVEIECG